MGSRNASRPLRLGPTETRLERRAGAEANEDHRRQPGEKVLLRQRRHQRQRHVASRKPGRPVQEKSWALVGCGWISPAHRLREPGESSCRARRYACAGGFGGGGGGGWGGAGAGPFACCVFCSF